MAAPTSVVFNRHSPDDFQAEEIVPPFQRKKNGIPTAGIRWPYFGDQSSF
jgi:hypothetical protein